MNNNPTRSSNRQVNRKTQTHMIGQCSNNTTTRGEEMFISNNSNSKKTKIMIIIITAWETIIVDIIIEKRYRYCRR